MSVFNEYGQYYNLLYQDKDYLAETAYILKLLQKYAAKSKELLELGCGTGKHATMLAKSGYSVLGIDLSETMLAEAQKLKNEQKQQVDFCLGDVRTFTIDKKFDSVISLFHIASYQTSQADILNYFKTAYKHLEKDGIFLFDFWYSPAVLSIGAEKRSKNMENELLKIQRKANPEHLPNENIMKIHYEVTISNKQSLQEHSVNEVHAMRYFSLPEIDYLLSQVGFKLIHSEEWLSGQVPSCSSWGVLCVAQKVE